MSDSNLTGYDNVVLMFHSMPMTKDVISAAVEQQYFLSAIAEYELKAGDLKYNFTSEQFAAAIPHYVVYTLALLMYTRYLMQELSRTLKLNGISGKDISVTGIPAAKTYTYNELTHELERTQQLLYQQQKHCFS